MHFHYYPLRSLPEGVCKQVTYCSANKDSPFFCSVCFVFAKGVQASVSYYRTLINDLSESFGHLASKEWPFLLYGTLLVHFSFFLDIPSGIFICCSSPGYLGFYSSCFHLLHKIQNKEIIATLNVFAI